MHQVAHTRHAHTLDGCALATQYGAVSSLLRVDTSPQSRIADPLQGGGRRLPSAGPAAFDTPPVAWSGLAGPDSPGKLHWPLLHSGAHDSTRSQPAAVVATRSGRRPPKTQRVRGGSGRGIRFAQGALVRLASGGWLTLALSVSRVCARARPHDRPTARRDAKKSGAVGRWW